MGAVGTDEPGCGDSGRGGGCAGRAECDHPLSDFLDWSVSRGIEGFKRRDDH